VKPGASPFRTLRGKLFVAVLLSSFVALALACAGLFAYDVHDYRAGIVNGLQIQAQLIGSSTAAALQFDDPSVAEQNLGFLQARGTIRSAAIYTHAGTLFARYVRPGVDGSAVPSHPEPPGAAISGDRARVFRAIATPGGENIGTVYLEADLELANRIWSYLAIAAAVMVSALLVSLLLSAWFQARITRPIIEMSDLAHQVVETRDYRLRARAVTNDEVGTLASAFNGMLSEIQSRTAAIEASAAEIGRLNEVLERRVGERTAQLEESNRMLEAANAAKSNFLSTVSHEIRTPMNGVLGMLELLSLSQLDGQQRTTLEVVRESGRSLMRIIDDILDFSKIEAGKLEVRMETASVTQILESVRSIYSGNASSKGLAFASKVDPRISPAVVVDPLRLQQILNNFVSNAIKFTSRGSVDITAELVERRDGEDLVRFSVSDTGIGIPAEAQTRLFQPFSQVAGAGAHFFGGTGLGLSIAQRLARLMGGSVALESEPGRGTMVSVILPMKVAAPETLRRSANGAPAPHPGQFSRPPAPSVEQAMRDGRLVLVVDDHPINRTVLSRQVGVLGYASESAEDGRQALGLWESRRYGLILTDCNMPEMSGYELARTIRGREVREGRARTVIIACTANALRGEAENCFAAGMDDYVSKPVDLIQLHAKLELWLPDPAAPRAATEEGGPAANAPPLDERALREISGDDPALRRELMTQFRSADDEDAARLFEAINARDMEGVVQAAHRIRGAGSAVGAHALVAAATSMESAARSGDVDGVLAGRDVLQRERARLAAYLALAFAATAEPDDSRLG
jgi:signal transduction histidine kinase/CheY-like chemotaxis protein